eukprot:5703-Heterococcus_DN1.PRE.8
MNSTRPLQLEGLDGGADWNMKAHAKSLGISNYAIELIATKAVLLVDSTEAKPARQMLPYFEQFHKLLSASPSELDIHFPVDTWPKAVQDLVTDVTGAQALFDSFCTPEAIAERSKPLLQDPTNPTNNVVARITPVGWSMLRMASDPEFALQEEDDHSTAAAAEATSQSEDQVSDDDPVNTNDSTASNTSTIRKAIEQQHRHNQATDASIAELREDFDNRAGVTSREWILGVLAITVLQVITVMLLTDKLH